MRPGWIRGPNSGSLSKRSERCAQLSRAADPVRRRAAVPAIPPVVARVLRRRHDIAVPREPDRRVPMVQPAAAGPVRDQDETVAPRADRRSPGRRYDERTDDGAPGAHVRRIPERDGQPSPSASTAISRKPTPSALAPATANEQTRRNAAARRPFTPTPGASEGRENVTMPRACRNMRSARMRGSSTAAGPVAPERRDRRACGAGDNQRTREGETAISPGHNSLPHIIPAPSR